jgi:hypothetical protein
MPFFAPDSFRNSFRQYCITAQGINQPNPHFPGIFRGFPPGAKNSPRLHPQEADAGDANPDHA